MSRWTCVAATLSALLIACGDDGGSEQSGTGGVESSGGSSGGVTGPSSSGADTSSTGDDTSPTTGIDPEDCVVQQGEGPCLFEEVVELPSSLVVFGDFDQDGDVDMLARSEETGPDEADQMVVLANDGGVFGPPTALPYSATPTANDRSVALSRPRPMGSSPAAVQSAFTQGTYGALGDVQVDAWWVTGAELRRFYEPTPNPPAGPWFGDFDGDGEVDLAFAPDDTSLDTLELHACTAQNCGNATDSTSQGAPAGPWTILGTDTTGDGLDELLVVREGDTGLEVVVLTNDGTNFAATSTLELGAELDPASARIEDVDADGRGDLLLTSTGDPVENSYGSSLYIFNQDGAGGLQAGPVIDAGERVTGYAVADFDGDDIPDIALRRTDLSIINIGLGPSFDGGVSYELTAVATGITGRGIPSWNTVVLDIDGNGTLDIITVTAQSPTTYAANVLRSSL